MSQHSYKSLKSTSLNLKEQVSYLSFKVYFKVVEKLVVLDCCYIVVIYYLSYLGCCVRLVGVR
jgi:hypothetical protein